MANIVSISTALPEYCHRQKDILHFMQEAYHLNDAERRKLAFMYAYSGIEKRYSVLPDYSLPKEQWRFITGSIEDVPDLNVRMQLFKQHALQLSVKAIHNCLDGIADASAITHLITVSCTGMSAPGLDLEIMEELNLRTDIFRTSVNFMGCYAAIHALKLGKMLCDNDNNANVLIVSTELCTLHFQQEYSLDNAASSLLFADGSAAVLLSNNLQSLTLFSLENFYSKVAFRGKKDMAWELNTKGFLMTLSGYIPQLIEEDISGLVEEALDKNKLATEDITHWCLHPGGRKILDLVEKKLQLKDKALQYSRKVLNDYGNMSSPTILFVLKEIMDEIKQTKKSSKIFGAAFGPGLTMETFIASFS
ncbi:MAG: type III polyketide synthase [Ilyomonas sp.]